jgi:hypothetical protein
MKKITSSLLFAGLVSFCFLPLCGTAGAQDAVILTQDQIEKIVPSNFYFEGQVGPTQMRNAAAVRFGEKQHFIAALVDTSGYASNIQGKYEGFIITGAPVNIGGVVLPTGAYGFGFTKDSKLNIFDVGGKQLHSLAAAVDTRTTSPRPLIIAKAGSDIRLYKGRTFVVVKAK